jgi:hypothetical protein
MRRLFAYTITALLVGVVINVAVAWSIMLASEPTGRNVVCAAEYDEAADMTWLAGVDECRGFLHIRSCHHSGRVAEKLELLPILASAVVQRIGDLHDWPTLDRDVGARHRTVVATGWTLPALWCACERLGAVPEQPGTRELRFDGELVSSCDMRRRFGDRRRHFPEHGMAIEGGLDLGPYRRHPKGVRQRRILPLRPLWPGFAVDTLVFAAGAWPLLLIAGAVRRRLTRLKRGHCPDCNHPIGGQTGCGNCGRRLPVAGSPLSRRSPTGRRVVASWRRARRLACITLIALVLAVVTNAAMAWACACQPTDTLRPVWARPRYAQFRADWIAHRPSFVPDADFDLVGQRRFGICRMRSQFGCDRPSALSLVWDEGRCQDFWREAEHFMDSCSECRLVVAGWPWPAFRGGAWSLHDPRPGEDGRFGLAEVRVGNRHCEVPFLPAWRGFGLNTLMFWAVYATLFGAPMLVRRAVRRGAGRCPSCAYPAGNEPICVECGEALPAFDVPSARPDREGRSAR